MAISELQYATMLARQIQKNNRGRAEIAETHELEKDLDAQVDAYCTSKGWLCVRSRTDCRTTTMKGVPDYIIFMPAGRVVCLELKSRVGKCTLYQLGFKAWLDKLGNHEWYVVRSMAEFLEKMKPSASEKAPQMP